MTAVTSRRSRTLRDAAAADRLSTIHLSPTCSRGESHASVYRVATRPGRQSGTHRPSTSPPPLPSPLRIGFATPPLSVLVKHYYNIVDGADDDSASASAVFVCRGCRPWPTVGHFYINYYQYIIYWKSITHFPEVHRDFYRSTIVLYLCRLNSIIILSFNS
ncbi:hypothetical protein ACI65C_007515 [Semiaphis heraclei]